MNILFFLTPKNEVAFIYEDDTLRQVLEKMEYHRYSAVPMIDRSGKYIGTLTEGDLLWGIKNQQNLSLKDAEKVPVSIVGRRLDNAPVRVGASMEQLIDKALNQNFVPVVDDQDNFIGIITRKDIIRYFHDLVNRAEPEKEISMDARVG
ncbi:MAG: CBS domain-containing protein [Lachnospiraceae bacterium]